MLDHLEESRKEPNIDAVKMPRSGADDAIDEFLDSHIGRLKFSLEALGSISAIGIFAILIWLVSKH